MPNVKLQEYICNLDQRPDCSETESLLYAKTEEYFRKIAPPQFLSEVPEESEGYYELGKFFLDQLTKVVTKQSGAKLMGEALPQEMLENFDKVQISLQRETAPEPQGALANPTPLSAREVLEAFAQKSILGSDGKPVDLRSRFNNSQKPYVLVSFFATWCEPCREEIPFLNDLQKSHPEIDMIAVTDESPGKYVAGRKSLQREPVYPVFHDKKANLRHALEPGATSIPSLWLFKSDGTLIGHVDGFSKAVVSGANPVWEKIAPYMK